MTLDDIARVEINWMEQFGNDPNIQFVLKRDRGLTPLENFRYRQFGRLFFAEHENEVNFMAHDINDHNGYGGRKFRLHMADDWDATQWRDCNRNQFKTNSGGGRHDVRCTLEGRILTLMGPWSSGESYASAATGIECVSVSTLVGRERIAINQPAYYHRMKCLGRAYHGPAYSTSYRLEFVREAVDRFAPHAELWQGDYGWTVKWRDMPPKNPRKRAKPVGDGLLSGEQSAIVYA